MGKIIPLEGLRGIASVIVVIDHFILAFIPHRHGYLGETNSDFSLVGSPFFVIINGTAAVTIFFALSGYVLAFAAFRDNPINSVGFAAAKRWARLAGPVFVSVLLSYLLFKLGAYWFEDAALITTSKWLGSFADGGIQQDFDPTLWQALHQSLWKTYFLGESYFNTNIWTMKWEFWGSFMVFGSSLLLTNAVPKVAQLFIFFILALLTFLNEPYLFPFIVGVGLHVFSIASFRMNKYLAIFLLLLGLYLSGYYYPERAYSWLRNSPFDANQTRIFIHTAGSTLFILILASKNRISDICQHRVFAFLGRISFALYLLHTILIMSVASFIFISLNEVVDDKLNYVITFLGFASILIPATLLLSNFDQWWLRTINRTGKIFFRTGNTK